MIVNKKKKTGQIMDFAFLAEHRIKLKEAKKRELKKLWNIKVTVMLIVISMLTTVTKGLVQGLEDLEIKRQVEII